MRGRVFFLWEYSKYSRPSHPLCYSIILSYTTHHLPIIYHLYPKKTRFYLQKPFPPFPLFSFQIFNAPTQKPIFTYFTYIHTSIYLSTKNTISQYQRNMYVIGEGRKKERDFPETIVKLITINSSIYIVFKNKK